MKINGIELKWLGHDGFQIKNSRMVYIDPFNIKDGYEIQVRSKSGLAIKN